MLEKMKIALRVKTDFFDAEILSVISAARADLVRTGVKPEKAQDETDELVTAAIRAYVLATYSTDTKMVDGYWQSYTYQLDCMRKSSEYMNEVKA